MRLVFALAVGALLVGCQSMSDVKPGDGRKATITGKSYDEIWEAAYKVSNEHFEVREQDKSRGVILAERTYHAFTPGAWVGVYIRPPRSGEVSYVVEVVQRNKHMGTATAQDWEYKVLRDIYRSLGLPALEPSRDPY